MLIDLHTHTKPRSWDSFITPDEMVDLAKQSGLDAVAIYKRLLYNPEADSSLISKDLKDYCKQDTQAILDVLKFS